MMMGQISLEISSLLLLHIVTSVLIWFPLAKAACRWEHCSREYEQSLEEYIDMLDEASVELCQALRSHAECMKKLSRSCRGNLRYYSYVGGVKQLNEQKNCSEILSDPLRYTSASQAFQTSTEPSIVLPAYHGCSTINLSSDMSYCSVFGDPHVITDDGHFQTCSIIGAYPLIENRHLAVQVTSKPVRRASASVTVTSIFRITVIVKHSECSNERKTYEVDLSKLNTFFTDMTSESDSIKLIERLPNQLVEIRILHLKTIIFIRLIGNYLSLAVRLPTSLLKAESIAPYQLCSAGCPAKEIISRTDSIKDLPIRSVQQAELWCQKHNLTGPFYEACLFDFALTSDFDAVLISKEAHQDWLRLAPLHSRTAIISNGKFSSLDPFAVNSAKRFFDIRWILEMRAVFALTCWFLFCREYFY